MIFSMNTRKNTTHLIRLLRIFNEITYISEVLFYPNHTQPQIIPTDCECGFNRSCSHLHDLFTYTYIHTLHT